MVMLCQNDSVGLLSFSPQPLTEGLSPDEFRLRTWLDVTLSFCFNFMSPRRVLKWLFGFFFSSVCLNSPLLVCVNSLSSRTLSSFSWWFITLFLFYSTCCYVWQMETAGYWALTCDMGTVSYQIPSRLNIIWWLMEHLSAVFLLNFYFSLRDIWPPFYLQTKGGFFLWVCRSKTEL